MITPNPKNPLTNERAARVLAALVVTTLAGAWLTDGRWVLPLLAVDFTLRALWGRRYSPLGRIAAATARLWPEQPVAAAPKRFAQGIGAVCVTLASLLMLAGYPAWSWALSGLVGAFATLEATVGFCFGCWAYRQLAARGLVEPEVCVDCTRPAGTVASGGRAPTPSLTE